jgi:hypothetical protein
MTPELTREELVASLDAVIDSMLYKAEIRRPPIDAFAVAGALRLTVASDNRQLGRARFVRLRAADVSQHGAILVRPDPRPERTQWAVAHEIGESRVEEVFTRLSVDPHEVVDRTREQLANQLANRLLMPSRWFERDALRLDWDLLKLKARYATASHELIARRMLEFTPAVIITVFDDNRVTWRQGNTSGRVPPLAPAERACQQRVAATGEPHREATSMGTIQAWPIHEPGWQREILRVALADID